MKNSTKYQGLEHRKGQGWEKKWLGYEVDFRCGHWLVLLDFPIGAQEIRIVVGWLRAEDSGTNVYLSRSTRDL